MKSTFLTFVIFFISFLMGGNLNSGAPIPNNSTSVGSTFKYPPYLDIRGVSKSMKIKSLKDSNIKILKNEKFTGLERDTVAKLLAPFLYYPIKKYVDSFACSKETLAGIIKTMFISESSDKHGNPARSIAFRKYNNPFGIKQSYGYKGVHLKTFEEINGKDSIMHCPFAIYPNLDTAITIWFKIVMGDRYIKVRKQTTAKGIFKALKECGYMTSSKWPAVALRIYQKTTFKENYLNL